MEMNRRNLLKGSVAMGAAGLVASKAAVAAVPAKWDETVDIVVIGSGFAGLAAAIEAKKAGSNVIVLEKMPTAGGNSIINGGILTATGCPQQKMHHIKDSVELLEHDILKAGNYMNDPKKVHEIASHALSNYEWCVNELGVEFLPDAIGQEGGHSVPRYVTTKNGSGSGIVLKELEMVKKLGVPIRLRTYVDHIVRSQENEGPVLGVVVHEGYRFPKAGSGKQKAIRARKGVILCYGGFSADVKFRTFQDPKLTLRLIRRISRAQRPNSGVKPAPLAACRSRTTGFSAARGATRRKRAWASAGNTTRPLLLSMASGSIRRASAS